MRSKTIAEQAALELVRERGDESRLAVVNPVALLRWNSDKSYLAELDAKGVPMVPTRITAAIRIEDLV